MPIDAVKIIRNKLDANNMSVRQLAIDIGVSYPTLNKSLNGKSGMNLDTFLKIADALGLDIVDSGRTSPVTDILNANKELKEDIDNLKTLTNFLKKENEELRSQLGK